MPRVVLSSSDSRASRRFQVSSTPTVAVDTGSDDDDDGPSWWHPGPVPVLPAVLGFGLIVGIALVVYYKCFRKGVKVAPPAGTSTAGAEPARDGETVCCTRPLTSRPVPAPSPLPSRHRCPEFCFSTPPSSSTPLLTARPHLFSTSRLHSQVYFCGTSSTWEHDGTPYKLEKGAKIGRAHV